MLLGPHDHVLEAGIAQQPVEVVGSVERPPHRTALDDDVGEQIVLPRPALVLGPPRRHSDRTTFAEGAAEPVDCSLGIPQEEDPEAAQHRRERAIRHVEVLTVHHVDLGVHTGGLDALASEAHHRRRQVDADRPAGRTDLGGRRYEHGAPSATDVEHHVARATPASSTRRAPKWSWYAPATAS